MVRGLKSVTGLIGSLCYHIFTWDNEHRANHLYKWIKAKDENIGRAIISKFYSSKNLPLFLINTSISYFITEGTTENIIVRTFMNISTSKM